MPVEPWLVAGPAANAAVATEPQTAREPSADLTMACGSAMRFLRDRMGFDLWLVTRLVEGEQRVLVAEPADGPVRAGDSLPWDGSFCRRMAAGDGPRIAISTAEHPAYVGVPNDPQGLVQAYAGSPLRDPEGKLLGTLCAYGFAPQPAESGQQQELFEFVGGMLAALLSTEDAAAGWGAAARTAQRLSVVDALTGLLNRRGWDRALAAEEQRCSRHDLTAGMVVIDVDGLKELNDTRGHPAGDRYLQAVASALGDLVRPTDPMARIGGDEFAVLAVESDPDTTRALQARIQSGLDAAGLPCSTGSAVRNETVGLAEVLEAADEAMYANKVRRGRLPEHRQPPSP